MTKNLSNLIESYKSLIEFKPNSPKEFEELALKIQSIAKLLKSYFISEFNEHLKNSDFLLYFNEAITTVSEDDCNKFIKSMKRNNYSPKDIVTILDANLDEDSYYLAVILCSNSEYYLKLNTYLRK